MCNTTKAATKTPAPSSQAKNRGMHCLCSDCAYVGTDRCGSCARKYVDRYVSGSVCFCPFCGYRNLFIHDDASVYCPKCGSGFRVKAGHPEPDYSDETWFDLPGFQGRYQVSSHLRIRSVDRTKEDNRRSSVKLIAVYPKNNELYATLWRDGGHREYNVASLLADAKRQCRDDA